jgi:apolipoprotein N-acyltransferase
MPAVVAEPKSGLRTNKSLNPSLASPWLCFFAAVVLLLFADGRNTIALAAWLAPVFLLRFVRTQPAKTGLFLAYLTLIVTRGIAMRGMIPIPGIFYYIFLIISGVSSLLPYIADRFLARRLNGITSTLLFPCTLVVAQFIYSHGPVGSWGSIPYTQSGNLPLLQLLSVTGLWGITFLIGWFASTVNGVWRQHDLADTAKALRPFALFSTIFILVTLLGSARLAIFPPSSPAVRVASLSPAKNGAPINADLLDAVTHGRGTDSQVAEFQKITALGQNDLFSRTEGEAAAGAKIIFWSETASYVLKQDESAVISRGRAIARQYHIYLGLALGTWTPTQPKPLENKFVYITPDGEVAWQYLKARPTPGPEMAAAVKSDGKLRELDSPYGKLSAAICYDMDFPSFMAQAGVFPANLVLSPAGDWKAIDPRHTQIASFRAIEQGFNLVRQSNGGLSAAYDYQGRQLASMDQYQSDDLTLVAEVPTRGARTFYSLAGDWFAYLSILTLAALILLALLKKQILMA